MRMPTEDDPLRVVELFSGIGSQAMALRNIGKHGETESVDDTAFLYGRYSNRNIIL